MKPIAQTFFVNEPENGVPGVYLTSLLLYFAAKGTAGVTIQIRETENGAPTKYILPLGETKIAAADVKISEDASVPTYVPFVAPLFLHSATSYAIVIVPDGGDPGYQIWTSDIVGTNDKPSIDVTTNQPIKTNKDTGTLFLSSNDLQWTAVQTEDIKFVLNRAEFKYDSGRAVFTSKRSDYMSAKDKIGNFYPREICVMSNNNFNLARLTMTSNTGAFLNGEVIFQSNGTANVATAKLFSANTSSVKVQNVVGTFVTSYQIKGLSSNSNGVISVVNDKVVTTEGSNNITVPFTNGFSTSATNQLIYIGKNDRSYMQTLTITQVINGTTLQVRVPASFSESAAMFGIIKGQEDLYGKIKIEDDPKNPNNIKLILDGVTSNTTSNFSNSRGKYLIGTVSGASVRLTGTYNSSYNTIVPQFAEAKPPKTDTYWSFVGAASSTKTMDGSATPLTNYVEKELYDYPRTLMSRSNEYANLPVGRKGDSTIEIYADMVSSNNKISPVIDTGAFRMATFASNQVVSKDKLYGFKVLAENHPFAIGDVVMQQNSATQFINGMGTVDYVTVNQVIITGVTGSFIPDRDIQLSTDLNTNVTPTELSYFSENYNSNYTYASRYISKNVILAEGQDAEDIRLFLTAYRPATTDFLVYVRFQNKEDTQKFGTKHWTKLEQFSSPALLSSSANINDFVELEYGLPKSIELFVQDCSCNSTSNFVTVLSTEQIVQNDMIYFQDNNSDKFFVSQVQRIPTDSTTLAYLSLTPPFDISNASFGVIPNMVDPQAAFIYSRNNNIIRYVNNKSVSYDSYKSFAVKIVPVAETTSVIPRAKDMRAIALQV